MGERRVTGREDRSQSAKLPRAWPCLPGSREGLALREGPHFHLGVYPGPSPLGARKSEVPASTPPRVWRQLIAQFLPSACLSHWLLG